MKEEKGNYALILTLMASIGSTLPVAAQSGAFQGAPRYGLVGEVRVSNDFLSVMVLQRGFTNVPLEHFGTNAAQTNSAIPKPFFPGYAPGASAHDWLPPTNRLAGPMELRDTNGNLVPLLQPTIAEASAYPRFERWSWWEAGGGGSHGLGGHYMPTLRLERGFGQLAFFKVSKYFQMKDPGEYTLKIWPKIYKRPDNPSEDRDLYQRIDLPPVTATIKWP